MKSCFALLIHFCKVDWLFILHRPIYRRFNSPVFLKTNRLQSLIWANPLSHYSIFDNQSAAAVQTLSRTTFNFGCRKTWLPAICFLIGCSPDRLRAKLSSRVFPDKSQICPHSWTLNPYQGEISGTRKNYPGDTFSCF